MMWITQLLFGEVLIRIGNLTVLCVSPSDCSPVESGSGVADGDCADAGLVLVTLELGRLTSTR